MLRVFHLAALRQRCIYPANLRARPRDIPRRQHVGLQRTFANLPTFLLPPLVFSGLVVVLWTWKCLMMVLFQNKIIYMPGLPPNAKRETIAAYKHQCGAIQWREERTIASDGTRISLCVASVDSGPICETMKRVYILYFQGILEFCLLSM